MRHLPPAFRLALAGVGALLMLLACNLGTSEAVRPPTIVPRASATPPPTLGFSGDQTTFAQQATIVPANISTPIADPAREVAALVGAVELDRLMVHVQTLQNFYTRHVNSTQSSPTQGIGAAREYISAQFRAIQQMSNGRLYTFDQEFQVTYAGMTTRQYNVVAVIQGTEPGAGTVVVGAHYDSIGQPMDSGTAYAPGANDNATGVAAILEIARILSAKPHRSSIMLVAFSAEEVGRRGSIAFARYLVEQRVDVIGMFNIDGIGNANDRRGNVNDTELRIFSDGPNETSISRHMARTAEFISFTTGLPIKMIVENAIDRENRYGDHFSFSEVGYPAIRFIQALEEKTNADPTDTIEYIEPEYFRRSVESILMVVSAYSDGPRPPRNISLRDIGGGRSTLLWEPIPDATGYIIALRAPGSLRFDQQIEWSGTSIDWDGFRFYAGVAIAARGPNGIVGPLSAEYRIRP
ncbi:M20/M25/M40 family metallo-hydrolase [Aggregatilineales bacterium SYSU G02658]